MRAPPAISGRHAVGPQSLERYLGHRLYAHEALDKADEVGVANGLAWTAAGGEILVVEALKMPGQGRVMTTGQLGEVMKESVQAAHSYVRSRADLLEIDAEAFSNYDIHIHFPAAGVPKDGPSAGITVGLVIASVLSDKPIRHDVAMTGEVSLRGTCARGGRAAREGAGGLSGRDSHRCCSRRSTSRTWTTFPKTCGHTSSWSRSRTWTKCSRRPCIA